MQVADRLAHDGVAELELHLLDHALAERGDVGFLDPVHRGQFAEDQGGGLAVGLAVAGWSWPFWASAATDSVVSNPRPWLRRSWQRSW